MGELYINIDLLPCVRWRDDDATCFGCTWKCEHARPAKSVYRPHRRAVIQAIWGKFPAGSRWLFSRSVLQARLGCPDAVAWVKRKRAIKNGVYLGQWSWARKPRGVSWQQIVKASEHPGFHVR